MSLTISWRADHTHTNLREVEYESFAEFCHHILKSQSKTIPSPPGPDASKDEKDAYKQAKINNAYFVRGYIPNGVRKGNENLPEAELIILDCDSKTEQNISPDKAHAALVKADITHYIFTSASHTDDSPSYRVIVPFKHRESDCERATKYVANLIPDVLVDSASWRWIQEWYLSRTGCWAEYHDGKALSIPSDFMPNDLDVGVSDSSPLSSSYEACLNDLFNGKEAHPNYYRMAQAMLARGGTPESVFRELEPIVRLAFKINNREYEDWRPERIRSAIQDGYQKDLAKGKISDIDFGHGPVRVMPHFDTKFIENWPDPWPLIFRNFEKCIYNVIPEIYVPACFSFHGILLGGIFKTVRSRGVNTNFQIVSASGVGKDSNTTEPIERITEALIDVLDDTDKGELFKCLSDLITNTVTSDTTYLSTLQSENHQPGGLVINTEASGHWDMVAEANNPHTEGVMRIEINMWDGKVITGKAIRGARYESIKNPNYSVLRLQQTEALQTNLTQRMVDIGLANRIDYFADNIDRPEIASTDLNDKDVTPRDDYIEFMEAVMTFVHSKRNNMIKVITGQPGSDINKFENDILLPLVNTKKVTRDEYKFLKRVIGSAEKFVTEITAYNYLWRMAQGQNVDDMIIGGFGNAFVTLDGAPFEKYVIPLLEYQLTMRRYLYDTIISKSELTAEDQILAEVFEKCKASTIKREREWLDMGYVPFAFFMTRVKVNKFFNTKKKPEYKDSNKLKLIVKNWMDTNNLKRMDVTLGDGRKQSCIGRA